MFSFAESVSKSLFGEETSHALAETYAFIECGTTNVDEKLLSLAAKQQDASIVAKVIVARAVKAPINAHYWLQYLNRRVFGDELFCHEAITGHFVRGVVLGLFETTVWFDRWWRTENKFMDEFPDICTEIIVGKNELQQQADELEIDSLYKGRLTNAIKAYAKGTESNKGVRLAHTVHIIKQVAERVDSAGMIGKEKVGVLGNLVLDQLTYALFSQLAPYARGRALNDWFVTFFEKPLGI